MQKRTDIWPITFFIGIALVFGNSVFNLYGYTSLKYSFILAGHLSLVILYIVFSARRPPVKIIQGFLILVMVIPYMVISFLQRHQVFDVTNAYLFASSVSFFLVGTILQNENIEFRTGKSDKAAAIFYFLLFFIGLAKFNEISFYDVSRNLDDYGLHPVGVAISFGYLCQISIFNAINSKTWARVVWALAGLEAFLIVFATGSRGVLVALVFLNLILTFNFYRQIKVLITLSGILTVAVVFWIFGNEFLSSLPFFDRIELAIDRARRTINPGQYGYVDFSGRREIWNYYLDTLGDWIFVGEYGYLPYPHNSILELFVRFGVFGALPAFALISLIIIASWKLFSQSLISVFVGQLFILDFIISMVNGSLEMHRFLFLGVGYFVFFLLDRGKAHERRMGPY